MAADTISVLDNLQFEHLNTATVNHVHADGFAGEAVESVAIPIDCEKISGLRVIVNNNYGATGSTIIAATLPRWAVTARSAPARSL